MRFFGFSTLSATARPNALTGVIESMAAIHFGIGAVVPGAGRFRQWRNPISTSTPPSTIFAIDVLSDAPLLPETSAPFETA